MQNEINQIGQLLFNDRKAITCFTVEIGLDKTKGVYIQPCRVYEGTDDKKTEGILFDKEKYRVYLTKEVIKKKGKQNKTQKSKDDIIIEKKQGELF